MAIEGPLRELGIHDVFQLLDLNRKTGVLTVSSTLRSNRGQVYFAGGAIVYASIQTNPHPLGGLLVRTGRASTADVRRARDMQRAGDGRRLGEILVAIGAVSKAELERQVRAQVEEVVFEVMGWEEGHFSFVEGPLEELRADATVRIPTSSILMEGARRIDEWSRIEKVVSNLGIVPVLAVPNGGDADVELRPADWEVLALIDAERSVRAIAQQLTASDFAIAKIVFGLAATGLIELSSGRREPDEPEGERSAVDDLLSDAERALDEGDHDRAWRRVEAAREQEPASPDVQVLLGALYLRKGQLAQAEAALRGALRYDPMLPDAQRLLGESVARQGRLGEAVDWWQRWLTFNDRVHEPEEGMPVRQAIQAALTLQAFLHE